jgi:hypothetical protein
MNRTKLPRISTQAKERVSDQEGSPKDSGSSAQDPDSLIQDMKNELMKRLPSISWIQKNANWPALKPVIRSSIAAWICLLFMLIYPTEQLLGQVRNVNFSFTCI